jgi:predicted ester cyclase
VEHMSVTGISIYRFEEGKVVEEWTEFDGIGMLAQMGVLPE